MIKNILVTAILLLVMVGLSGAEIFKIKYIGGKEKRQEAREKSSGRVLWKSENSTEKMVQDGKLYLYITEKGEGIYGKDRSFKSWESNAYYLYDGTTVIPDQAKKVYKDEKGNVIQIIEKFYHPEQKTIIVKVNGQERPFEYQDDVVDQDLLATAIGNYPYAEKRDFVFHILTNEPRLYPMNVKYVGEETLTVAGQSVASYKLQMVPDLGALNIFGAFVPKTYFWFSKAPPYNFLRYEGLESGLGTPYIVIETVN